MRDLLKCVFVSSFLALQYVLPVAADTVADELGEAMGSGVLVFDRVYDEKIEMLVCEEPEIVIPGHVAKFEREIVLMESNCPEGIRVNNLDLSHANRMIKIKLTVKSNGVLKAGGQVRVNQIKGIPKGMLWYKPKLKTKFRGGLSTY